MYGRIFGDGSGSNYIKIDGLGGSPVIYGDGSGGRPRTCNSCADDIGDILDE